MKLRFKSLILIQDVYFSHSMQLCIISALQSDVTFSTALAKAQTISRKYSCSTKAKDILKRCGFGQRLTLGSKTRWWSELEMVKKIIGAYESNSLNAMIREMKWSEEILWSEILILKSYVAIFTVFAQSSDFLGSEKNTTIALVYPIINILRRTLAKQDHAVKQFTTNLDKLLTDRFK